MSFTNYLEDENDKPYFTKNSLAYYYDKMEGFAKAVEGSAKALNLTKEEIEQRIALRLAEWDKNLETFDGSVEKLLSEWVNDGTLTHVIDSTLIDQKIAPLAEKLAGTASDLEQRAINVRQPPFNVSQGIDQTSVLQSVLDYAYSKGLSVILPPGEYVAGTLTVKVSVTGSKTSILKVDRINIKADDVILKGFKILSKGNVAVAVDGTDTMPYKNVSIKDIHIDFEPAILTNWISIRSQYAENLNITEVVTRLGGLQLVSCNDFYIAENRIDGDWRNTNEPIHVSSFSRGIITENTIKNVANTDAIDLFSSGERCIVTNNRCMGLSGYGMELKVTLTEPEAVTGDSRKLGFVESTIVSGNLFSDFRPNVPHERRAGIAITYVDARNTPVYELENAQKGLVVTGNIIEDYYKTYSATIGNPTFNAIRIEGSNSIISNNVIRNIYHHNQSNWETCGISLAGAGLSRKAVGCIIDGNIISGCEGSGIRLYGAEKTIITNNIIRKDETTGLTPRYGIFGMDGFLDKCRISSNIFECSPENGVGIYIADKSETVAKVSETIISENHFIGCGISTTRSTKSIYSSNIIDYTKGTAIGIIPGGVIGRGNQITSNNITSDGTYSISIANQQGFLIDGNHISKAGVSAILINTPCSNGLIKNNISYSQTGADVVRLLGLIVEDAATIKQTDNITYT